MWKLERGKVINAKDPTAPLYENFVLVVHKVVY